MKLDIHTQESSLKASETPFGMGRTSQLPAVVFMSCLCLGAVAIFSLNWRFSLMNGSYGTLGGVSTVGASRVLQGEIPYRDFWTSDGPGQFYLLALVFRIFGTHLMVEVVAASVVCALGACACYQFIRNLTHLPLLALAGAGIFLGILINTGYYLRLEAYPPAILLVLVSLNSLVTYYRTSVRHQLLISGLAVGLSAIFFYELAIISAISVLAGILLHCFHSSHNRATAWRDALLNMTSYVAGALVVTFPVVLFFSLTSGADFWKDVIIFVSRDWRVSAIHTSVDPWVINIQSGSRSELIDSAFAYVKYAMPFAFDVLGLILLGYNIRARKPLESALALTIGLAGWLHYYVAHVHIGNNIVSMSTYAVALSAMLYGLLASNLNGKKLRILQLAAVVILLGWFSTLTLRTEYNLVRKQFDRSLVELRLARVSGFKVMPYEAESLTNLVGFVTDHVAPDQPIFVGLNRHDIMLTNDVLAYFVLDRPPAVRYHELNPAVADTAEVQQEMIDDLEKKKPPVIITKTIFPDDVLDQVKADFRTRLPDIGAEDLDRYIHEHYVFSVEFAPYTVWTRRQAPL